MMERLMKCVIMMCHVFSRQY